MIDHNNCSGPPNQIPFLQILSDLDNLQIIHTSLKREMGQYYNLQSQTNTNSKKEALFEILRSVLLRGVNYNIQNII